MSQRNSKEFVGYSTIDQSSSEMWALHDHDINCVWADLRASCSTYSVRGSEHVYMATKWCFAMNLATKCAENVSLQ